MGLDDTIRRAVQKDTPSVTMDDTLRSAVLKMADNDVSALVVKSDEELIGIITDLDMMSSLADNNDPDKTLVRDFMTPCELITGKASKSPCVQLHQEENIKNAIMVMSEAGVHNLLVSGDGDKALGMISARELLKAALS